MIRTYGVDDPNAHLRRSVKSLAAEARLGDAVLPTATLMSPEQEFSFSTLGILLLLVFWSVPPPQSYNDKKDTRCSSARRVLRVLLDFIFGAEKWNFEAHGGSFTIAGGKVDAKAAMSNCKSLHWFFEEGQIHLVDFLLELGRLGHRGSRLAIETKLEARAVMLALFGFASDIVEVYGKDSFSDASSSLPVLRLRSSRARRFSSARKLDLARRTQDADGVRKMEQFVASQEALAKRGDASSTVSFKSAYRFVRDNVFQYYLSARQFWKSAQHVGIVADCGRISGHDLMVNMAFSSEGRRGSWGPKQAISGGPETPFSPPGRRFW